MSEITQADIEKAISECYWRKEVAKEKLRECAIKQRRINGKFASNIHDNYELLEEDKT